MPPHTTRAKMTTNDDISLFFLENIYSMVHMMLLESCSLTGHSLELKKHFSKVFSTLILNKCAYVSYNKNTHVILLYCTTVRPFI